MSERAIAVDDKSSRLTRNKGAFDSTIPWDQAFQQLRLKGGIFTAADVVRELAKLKMNVAQGTVRAKLSKMVRTGKLNSPEPGRFTFPQPQRVAA